MQLLRVFKKITNQIFGIKEVTQIYFPTFKTTSQLIAEGRATSIPKCYRRSQRR